MYLFPSITIPKKAVAVAKSRSMSPDAFYSLELLEATGMSLFDFSSTFHDADSDFLCVGLCVVSGSGFGQKENSTHVRTTFLAPHPERFVERWKKFHDEFMNKYRD